MPESAPNPHDDVARGSVLRRLKAQAQRLGAESYALYVAAQDPRTPWYARWLAAFVVAYAVSPVDLIPDFIPVVGYLDDLVLVPIGIAVAIALIPPPVWQESRAKAREVLRPGAGPTRAVVVVIVSIWLASAAFAIWLGFALFSG